MKNSNVYFINTPYMDEDARTALNAEAKIMGVEKITWIKTGRVIASHDGPGAFGILGTIAK